MGIFSKDNSRPEQLKNEIKSLEQQRDTALDDYSRTKRKLDEVQAQIETQERELKHLMRMKEEALEIAYKKKEIELEKQKADDIADVKDKYRDKMEAELNKQVERMQQMYSEILGRLPNFNVKGSVDLNKSQG